MRSSMSHEEGVSDDTVVLKGWEWLNESQLQALTTDSWGARMAPDFYETIDARERDRQEAMNEIIHGEEQYLKDMELLQNVSGQLRGIDNNELTLCLCPIIVHCDPFTAIQCH